MHDESHVRIVVFQGMNKAAIKVRSIGSVCSGVVA